jgi:hypothetical protein
MEGCVQVVESEWRENGSDGKWVKCGSRRVGVSGRMRVGNRSWMGEVDEGRNVGLDGCVDMEWEEVVCGRDAWKSMGILAKYNMNGRRMKWWF